MRVPLLPPSASTLSDRVDALYFSLIAVCGLVLFGIAGVMIFLLLKYRRGRCVFRQQRSCSTLPFELAWTIIPTGIFLGFFVWGAEIYQQMQRVPAGALEIQVVGQQWMWKALHPGGQGEIDELHVPVDRDVKLTLASQDVIHSFYIPAFRLKQDVVPGRYTTAWFRAARLGRYHLFCAEYCGKDHSRMQGWVEVMSPEAYENWLVRAQPAEPTVTAGARLFRELGCSGCHAGNGPVRAPPLEGLFGRPVALSSRVVVLADEAYLHDSILYPNREVAAGYEPLMPSYEGRITEEQLFQLIAYLKWLAASSPVRDPPVGPTLRLPN
ncbi:MAG: cytochrome c oxidase subunit II [Verrucomicrobiota bacterium]